MRLRVEIGLARLAGRLSRAAGKGVEPRFPAGFSAGSTATPWTCFRAVFRTDPCSSARRTARRRRARWSRRSSGPAFGSRTTARAQISCRVSPRRSSRARTPSSGSSRSTRPPFPRWPRRTHPRAVVLANLFRDQLDRYGELEIVAERWRAAIAALGDDATVVVNVDDPLLADLVRGPRERGAVRARRSSRLARAPPPRRRLEVLRRLRDALRVRRDVRRTPRRLPLPPRRRRAAASRRHRAVDRAGRARRVRVRPRHSRRRAPRPARAPRPL